MKNYNIYSMREEHLDDLVNLERECFSTPWTYDGLKTELENPNAVFLVAVDNWGDVLGYIGFHSVVGEGYIENIAVFQKYRCCGIGAELIKEILKNARDRKLGSVVLEVRETNVGAIELYKKIGFTLEGRRKNLYDCPTEDGLVFKFDFIR